MRGESSHDNAQDAIPCHVCDPGAREVAGKACGRVRCPKESGRSNRGIKSGRDPRADFISLVRMVPGDCSPRKNIRSWLAVSRMGGHNHMIGSKGGKNVLPSRKKYQKGGPQGGGKVAQIVMSSGLYCRVDSNHQVRVRRVCHQLFGIPRP